MEEQSEDLTPFWLQSSSAFGRADHRGRRSSSSLFFNSGVFVVFLLVTAILSIVFVIPSLHSFTSQIFKPNSVKKSWDSLNIVLVLFAVVFGFLSRNRNEDSSYGGTDRAAYSNANHDPAPKSNPSTPHHWYEYPDRMVYSSPGIGGLRRNSSSYPDLREAAAASLTSDDRWRFLDDTHVESYQISDSGHLLRRRSWREVEAQVPDTKSVIHVDTFISRPKEVSEAPPPSPPPPPVTVVKQRPKRTLQSVAQKEKKPKEQVTKDPEPDATVTPPAVTPQPPVTAVKQRPKRTHKRVAEPDIITNEEAVNDSELKESIISPAVTAPPPTPPPPPPPPPPLPTTPLHYYADKSSKSNKKRVGANATKEFLTSFYLKKKKKRQRRRSIENFEDLLRSQSDPLHQQPPPSTPPPPPPPPPPPQSVFHSLFSSKKSKHKRSHSDPPPELQPPLTAARASRTSAPKAPITARRPPIPAKISNFTTVDANTDGGDSPLIISKRPMTGGESPLIRIPPPPPPPPFKIPAWKFVVQGDYVRVLSNNSSRSGSPDLEDVDSSQSSPSAGSPSVMNGGDAMASLFCPSPDVDTKADNFIARFRAGLKLEKNNSINRLGPSNLGPEGKPTLSPDFI